MRGRSISSCCARSTDLEQYGLLDLDHRFARSYSRTCARLVDTPATMPELGWYAGAAVGVLFAMRWASAAVYDVFVVKLTQRWYASVLKDLEKSSTLLDVGIGTATALRRNVALVEAKDLRIAGVDSDAAYITAAAARIAADAKLRDRVSVVCASVYDGGVLAALRPKGGFDAAYFSGSLTLLPDPVRALQAVAAVVKPGGRVYVTQTYQKGAAPVMRVVKPLLKYVTTVDFGQLTSTAEAERIFRASELELLEHGRIVGSVDTARQCVFRTVLRVPK